MQPESYGQNKAPYDLSFPGYLFFLNCSPLNVMANSEKGALIYNAPWFLDWNALPVDATGFRTVHWGAALRGVYEQPKWTCSTQSVWGFRSGGKFIFPPVLNIRKLFFKPVSERPEVRIE